MFGCCFIFGDWCVDGMWGGGHGVVILGIVVVMVLN